MLKLFSDVCDLQGDCNTDQFFRKVRRNPIVFINETHKLEASHDVENDEEIVIQLLMYNKGRGHWFRLIIQMRDRRWQRNELIRRCCSCRCSYQIRRDDQPGKENTER